MRARFASIVLIAWWTAAEPVAQAFSTRVAGLKRKLSFACSTSEAVKSCGEKPALKWPSRTSAPSRASPPACSSASSATRTIRPSTVSLSSLPNGVWAQPTMQAVMARSSQYDRGNVAKAEAPSKAAGRKPPMCKCTASGRRPQQEGDAGDDEDNPEKLSAGGSFGEKPVRDGLRHRHLDEGERAHIRGRRQSKADEPELRGERA